MKKLLPLSLLVMCSVALANNSRAGCLNNLQERMHPRAVTARAMAGVGTVLLYCGNPVNRLGFLTVVTAYALQANNR